jgi:hypothetical protein
VIVTPHRESLGFRLFCLLIAGCLIVSLAGPQIRTANAQPPTHVLADGTSYLNIDVYSQATVYDWFVDEPVTGQSIDHLKELSNWYRVDDPISGPGPETSVSTLNILSQVATNTNADPQLDTLNVLYGDPLNRFQMRIIYNITDGGLGSGQSQLDEDISIFNLSFSDDLSIHVFEYVDLDLHNTPGDDIIQLTGPGSLYQHDSQTDYAGTFEADRYELNYYPNTVNKLMDGNTDILNDAGGSGAGPIGPDDVTWALQWDFVGPPPGTPPGFRYSIPPRTTAYIHKEGILHMYYVAVPEPTSAVLASLGGVTLLLSWRRRSVG